MKTMAPPSLWGLRVISRGGSGRIPDPAPVIP
jgi:hypothetical protein